MRANTPESTSPPYHFNDVQYPLNQRRDRSRYDMDHVIPATSSKSYYRDDICYDRLTVLSDSSSKGTPVRQDEDEPRPPNDGNNIYVGHLSKLTTSETLSSIFSKYGPILGTEVIMNPKTGQSRQFGFVKFASVRDADDAIDGLKGTWIDGTCPRIERARRSREHESTPGVYMGEDAAIFRRSYHSEYESSSHSSTPQPRRHRRPSFPKSSSRWTRTHVDDREFKQYDSIHNDFYNPELSKYRGRLYADDSHYGYFNSDGCNTDTSGEYHPPRSRVNRLSRDGYEDGYDGDVDTDCEKRERMLRDRSREHSPPRVRV
ncbi:hypothetical protein SeLEV6574_g06449 [Synchytrium endobioticum]|nr:hypothetical protein SeLEV6574_g06449 [Synchytrium endobioticum]